MRQGRQRERIHRQRHTTARPGNYGPRRFVPYAADDRVRNSGGRRRYAGKRRPEVRRERSDLQHGRTGSERNRCERNGDLRSADVRRRCDDGGG